MSEYERMQAQFDAAKEKERKRIVSESPELAEIKALLAAKEACEHSHLHALARALNGDEPLSLPEMVEKAVALKNQLSEKEAQVKGLVEALEILEKNAELFSLTKLTAYKALSLLPTTQLERYRAEKAVIEAAETHWKVYGDYRARPLSQEAPCRCVVCLSVKALKEMETK